VLRRPDQPQDDNRMLRELLRASIMAGIPVALASYFLFSWALRRRQLGTMTSLKEVEQEIKRQSKEQSRLRKERKRAGVGSMLAEGAHLSRASQLDLVHNKWLAFGGGFYGVVGLLTYVVVELGDLRDFLLGFESVWALISRFGLDMLVELLVNALRNFVVAIAWPAYWLSDIHSDYIWLWFAVAYAAYWGGARLALQRFRPESHQ
jgi:hypothetical protein